MKILRPMEQDGELPEPIIKARLVLLLAGKDCGE
jgi:hypothetical protein